MKLLYQPATARQRCFATAVAAVLTLVVGVIFFVRYPSQAQTVIPLSACTTISSSGSYQVAADINVTDPADGACFNIDANDVILDGNGKTVTINRTNLTNPVYAADIVDISNTHNWHDITVKNINSNAGVRVFGDTISNITFDHLTVLDVSNFGGDDVTITNNTIGEGGVQVNGNDQPTWRAMRTVIRDNTVTGGLASVSKLVFIVGGTEHPCPEIDTVLDNNNITSTHTVEVGGLNAAIRVGCATHIRVTNNTVRSTGLALGIYIRDESDDGVYENNTVITNIKPALWLGSGNVDKTYPSRNTFHDNVFRTEAGYGFYAIGSGSANVFTNNIFYANDPDLLGYVGGYFGNTYDHNTFYNAATGGRTLSLMGDSAEGPPADTFTNNIFSYNGASVFGYDGWRPSRYDGGNYNLFHNRGGVLSFGSYGNLAAWRVATSDDANSISGDPLLTNPAGGDFSLQIGSPALSAASNGTNIGAWQVGDVVTCTESWSCSEWSSCVSGTQTRTCTDANLCGTTTDRPALTQSCSCTESWICSEWSACTDGTQSKTCTDSNNCGTTVSQPSLTQSCVVVDTLAPAVISDLRAL